MLPIVCQTEPGRKNTNCVYVASKRNVEEGVTGTVEGDGVKSNTFEFLLSSSTGRGNGEREREEMEWGLGDAATMGKGERRKRR